MPDIVHLPLMSGVPDPADLMIVEDVSAAATKRVAVADLLSGGGPPTGAAGGSLAGIYPNPTLASANADDVTWTGAHDFVAGINTNSIGPYALAADTFINIGSVRSLRFRGFNGAAYTEFAHLKYTGGLSLKVTADLDVAGVLMPYTGGGIYARNGGDSANNGILVFDTTNVFVFPPSATGATVLGYNTGQTVSLGGTRIQRRAVAGDIAMGIGDTILAVTDTSVARTVTLLAPPAVGAFGDVVVVIIEDESDAAGTHAIAVVTPSGAIIVDGVNEGASTSITTNGGSLSLYSDGTNWRTL